MNFLLAVSCRKSEKLFNTPAIISFLPKRLSQSNPGQAEHAGLKD